MRPTLSILLSLALLLGVMPAMPVKAESAVKETRYQLVTACINVWKSSSGVWQNGVQPGADQVYNGAISGLELTGDFDRIKVSNVRFYNNKTFDPTFDFATKNFAWNSNPQYAPDKDAFVQNYYMYSLRGLTAGTPEYSPKDGKVSFSYSGNLETIYGQRIDLKARLADNAEAGANQIAQMMGYGSLETAPADLRHKLLDMYPAGGQASDVEGYLFFAPFLLEYDVLADALLPPKVLIDCKATSMFIGLNTPVRGAVQNRNTVPVITRYRLTANDTLLKSGTALQEAGKSLKVESTYTIPAATKPGKLFTFRLWAEQTAAYTAPDRHLPREEGEPPVENPDYAAFAAAHTYVPQAGAWYKNDAPWLPGQAECRKTAVLQPEAPLDHRLNPAVIVE